MRALEVVAAAVLLYKNICVEGLIGLFPGLYSGVILENKQKDHAKFKICVVLLFLQFYLELFLDV